MPRRRSPPRLYFDQTRQQWAVRDGSAFVRTGRGKDDRGEAEKILAAYIVEKHAPEPANDPLIADAMNVYATEAAPHLKTAKKIAYHIDSVLGWWGAKRASEVTAKNCRAYAATKRPQMARADINGLKWALTYWHNDSDYGPLSIIPTYWRPDRNPPRERWLTRSEAARSLGGAALPAHPPLHPARSLHRLAVWCPAGDAVGSDRSRRWIHVAAARRRSAGTPQARAEGQIGATHPRAPAALETA